MCACPTMKSIFTSEDLYTTVSKNGFQLKLKLFSHQVKVWGLPQYLPHLGQAYHYAEEILRVQNFVKK